MERTADEAREWIKLRARLNDMHPPRSLVRLFAHLEAIMPERFEVFAWAEEIVAMYSASERLLHIEQTLQPEGRAIMRAMSDPDSLLVDLSGDR